MQTCFGSEVWSPRDPTNETLESSIISLVAAKAHSVKVTNVYRYISLCKAVARTKMSRPRGKTSIRLVARRQIARLVVRLPHLPRASFHSLFFVDHCYRTREFSQIYLIFNSFLLYIRPLILTLSKSSRPGKTWLGPFYAWRLNPGETEPTCVAQSASVSARPHKCVIQPGPFLFLILLFF